MTNEEVKRILRRMIFVETVKSIIGTLLGYLLLLAEMAGITWILWNLLFVRLLPTLPTIPFYGLVVIAIVNIASVFAMTSFIKKLRERTQQHGS